jgi:hypothetical protein
MLCPTNFGRFGHIRSHALQQRSGRLCGSILVAPAPPASTLCADPRADHLDDVLDSHYDWLCRRRRDYSANSEVWAFRRDRHAPWELGIFSASLCGVDHRQDTLCYARIKRPCFKEVRCVRLGQSTKTCVRVHAHGDRLHAIGGGHSEPCFAVAFRSDGEGMVGPSGSRTECGYFGRKANTLQSRNKRGYLTRARTSRQ